MLNTNSDGFYEIIYVIVNYGMGSKVLQKAKKNGLTGGTVCIGKGTIQNPILNFFSLYDERKEIVILGVDVAQTESIIDKISNEFEFQKPNHGILFSISTCVMLDSQSSFCVNEFYERGVNNMYHLITAIVNKGKAVEVVNASRQVGATGGTIINARGSGGKDTVKIFNMEIEPEKEVVLILTESSNSESVVSEIQTQLQMDKSGNGVIFVQTVNHVKGLFQNE